MGRGPAAVLVDSAANALTIIDDSGTYRFALPMGAATQATLATLATESKLETVRVLLASLDGKDYATQTTLATLATEAKLEAVRVLLASLDGKDFATQTTLAAILVDTGQIEALLGTIDVDTSNLDVLLSTRATEATLAAADAKLATIDGVLDSIKDTDGIKKITDELPAGTQEIGAVKQGTKAIDTAAWPFKLASADGLRIATITTDVGVERQEIVGKVQVTGAVPPPATTAAVIFANVPLTVGTHDTTFTIPTGQTFHLQEITAGNEDPTKGSVIEVIFDDGAEHLIERVYTNGETVSIGYPDQVVAQDGTSLLGAAGTSDIIVRRAKYAGSDIAIDATVVGYTV